MKSVDYPAGFVEEWEQFLSQPRTLDDLFSTNLLFPLQRQRELERMLFWSGTPKSYMEIGACSGGCLWAYCSAFKLTHATAIEPRGCPYAPLFEIAFPHTKFTWIEERSDALAAVQTAYRVGPYDVLFIDGDKHLFRQDFDACVPFVRSVVFMHDQIDNEPCERAFNEVDARKKYRSCRYVDTSEVTQELFTKTSPTPYENWLRHWKGRSCGFGRFEL